MRVGFVADIHIKLGQKNVPVEWARNRFRELFAKLRKIEVDKWIIGGDVFDKMPTLEELELYYELILSLDKPTVIIPGNHESVKKNTTFLTNLKTITARLNPLVMIVDDFYSDEEIDYIPYNKLKEYSPAEVDFHNRILVTHVRGEIPPHVKPEVPLELFERWDIVLAGDLHSHSNSQRNIVYPGSPVSTSFHREEVDTGIVVLDTSTLEYKFISLGMPQLLRKTIQAGEPMPPGTRDHIVYEVEGDAVALAQVSGELLDKKLVKRSVDTALMLSPDMTVVEELQEYLLYILELDQKIVERLVGRLLDIKGFSNVK